MDEELLIKERKDKVIGFFKKNFSYVTYVLLAIIVFISVWIRTRNLYGLKDITTGTWTLGPDLDPFLFLRWAKDIVANGHLMAVDCMRYVPLCFQTKNELPLTPYLISWVYKVGAGFGIENVAHAAVLYPVIMFALTIIAFFFMTRKIFEGQLEKIYVNSIALVSSLFLVVLPSLLPRTIAGIPEKEAGAFFFMFLAFYFFLVSWRSKKNWVSISLAVLSGIATALMALTWGGYIFIYLTIGPAIFISFLLDKVERKKIGYYALWLIVSFSLMIVSSGRYDLSDLVSSVDSGFATLVLAILIVHQGVLKIDLMRYIKSEKIKRIPIELISTILAGILSVVVASLVFGIGFIPSKISFLWMNLITPSANRLLLTVAENRQPYFSEWAGNFGPILFKIPLTFWLFFLGSIWLFYNSIKHLKNKNIITTSFVIFLVSIIFSRYSSTSLFNGINFISEAAYLFGFLIFALCSLYYLYKYNREGIKGPLKEIDFGLIFAISFFLIGIVAARSAVRTIMVLVPPVSVVVGYFIIDTIRRALKDKKRRVVIVGLAVVIALAGLSSVYLLYGSVSSTASGYIPSSYTQQWQKAMGWARSETPETAVFAHWWDYGYWVQSIGERATVLDGGNAISYWNHLLGRHVLTGSNDSDALGFLYSHNATHLLIDSTDIGKYTAFSSIGSDEQYDRRSWIPALAKDSSQTVEKKNTTLLVYTGGNILDGDIIYEEDGEKIFLPGVNNLDLETENSKNLAGMGAVSIEINQETGQVLAANGAYYYNGQRYLIPVRYVFYNHILRDLGRGINASVFVLPALNQDSNGVSVDPSGAILYLSQRTYQTNFARLYLYGEDDSSFNLVHTEDDFVVSQLKASSSNYNLGDFIYYQGVRGPIKIWKINYPADISVNKEYLETDYPDKRLLNVK